MKNNKERYDANRLKYQRMKWATDPNFKIRSNVSRRINSAIHNGSKSARTLELLGCSIKQLKESLEDDFEAGMTWDNYGEWHIDHIEPCSSFDLTDPFYQKICFNWMNLQPLWARDNIAKGSKLDWVK